MSWKTIQPGGYESYTRARLSSDPTSNACGEKTLIATRESTFLQASADGSTLSNSQDGHRGDPSGQDHAPASLSASQDARRERMTRGTSGRSSSVSSASAALQRSLASRLRAQLDENGSPEYSLTWKHWDMPSREPICVLRASAHRISASGSTGWPTPASHEFEIRDVDRMLERRREQKALGRNGNGFGMTLGMTAMAVLSGWATPTTRDWKDSPGMVTTRPDGKSRLDQLGRQAFGIVPSLSNAPTESTGGSLLPTLNPAFSRWLMGFPPEWDVCAPMETRSSRRSQPRSSKHS